MENCSLVWSHGRASVQLLLNGKYRAINNLGKPKLFDVLKEAIEYAQASK